jgi:hypothetical protein
MSTLHGSKNFVRMQMLHSPKMLLASFSSISRRDEPRKLWMDTFNEITGTTYVLPLM